MSEAGNNSRCPCVPPGSDLPRGISHHDLNLFFFSSLLLGQNGSISEFTSPGHLTQMSNVSACLPSVSNQQGRDLEWGFRFRAPKQLPVPPVGRVISAGPAMEHDATLAFLESENLLLQGVAATTWTKGIAWSIRIVPNFSNNYLGLSPSFATS